MWVVVDAARGNLPVQRHRSFTVVFRGSRSFQHVSQHHREKHKRRNVPGQPQGRTRRPKNHHQPRGLGLVVADHQHRVVVWRFRRFQLRHHCQTIYSDGSRGQTCTRGNGVSNTGVRVSPDCEPTAESSHATGRPSVAPRSINSTRRARPSSTPAPYLMRRAIPLTKHSHRSTQIDNTIRRLLLVNVVCFFECVGVCVPAQALLCDSLGLDLDCCWPPQ